eukprot:2846513-Pyramimonas_sp.AAC.1
MVIAGSTSSSVKEPHHPLHGPRPLDRPIGEGRHRGPLHRASPGQPLAPLAQQLHRQHARVVVEL